MLAVLVHWSDPALDCAKITSLENTKCYLIAFLSSEDRRA